MFPNQNLNKTKQKKKLQERGRGENREIKATVMLQGISFFEEHKGARFGHRENSCPDSTVVFLYLLNEYV